MNARKWLTIIALLAIWFGFVRIYTKLGGGLPGSMSAPEMAPVAFPKKMATGWSLKDPAGKAFDWSTTKEKLILVNIWATWCPPCRAELPSLANLAKDAELKDKLVVICASTDDSQPTLASYQKKNNIDFPAYYALELPGDSVTQAIPATFLLQDDGTLIAFDVGSAQWDDPGFISRLKRMHAEKYPAK